MALASCSYLLHGRVRMQEILALELWRQLVILIPMGIILLIAAITDWRERKVYNKLTYPSILIGLVAHTIAMGFGGLADGLIAAIVMFVLGLLLLMTPAIKGGDIKLMIGIGAFVGGRGLFEIFFYSVFTGFFIGILMSLFNGYLKTLLKRIWYLIKGYVLMLVYRSANLKPELEEDERSKMPFAVAIFFGCVCTITEYTVGYPGLLKWYLKGIGVDV